MWLELQWGRWRRGWLRRFFPSYVRQSEAMRQGSLLGPDGTPCPDPDPPIDARDLKYVRNVTGYSFPTDPFAWRGRLGLARWGLGEVVCLSLLAGLVLTLTAISWNLFLPGWLAGPIAGLVAILWLLVLYFFRDPERKVPADAHALVSPADGTITEIAEADDATFPGGRVLRISIFLSVFNVHVNRAPRTAIVTALRYFPGKFLNALRVISAVENEQLWIDFRDEATGQPFRVKQIAGAIARRIVCQLRLGEAVRVGDRFGMIKVGSRTEVLLPAAQRVSLQVKVGDAVRGGSTVLLTWE